LSSLSDIRKNIDSLDDEIIVLLLKRLELVIQTIEKKKSIEDINREEQIIEKLKHKSVDPDSNEYLTKIYRTLFEEGKRIQEKIKRNDHEKI
jgi:chorismate mutase / prephenate dehydratase